MSETDHLLSTTDLAAVLRLSSRTVQRLAARGVLPCVCVAGTPVYSVRAVARTFGVPPALIAPGALVSADEARRLRADLDARALQSWAEHGRLRVIRIGAQRRYDRAGILKLPRLVEPMPA